MISRSRYLSTDLKEIFDPVIQENSFFAHPENILIAVINDDREHARELGLRRNLKARHTSTTRSVRQFRLPTSNFASADYTEMINWSAENITEPPLTSDIAEKELMKYIKHNNTPATKLEN